MWRGYICVCVCVLCVCVCGLYIRKPSTANMVLGQGPFQPPRSLPRSLEQRASLASLMLPSVQELDAQVFCRDVSTCSAVRRKGSLDHWPVTALLCNFAICDSFSDLKCVLNTSVASAREGGSRLEAAGWRGRRSGTNCWASRCPHAARQARSRTAEAGP